jgi:hypothetical protein
MKSKSLSLPRKCGERRPRGALLIDCGKGDWSVIQKKVRNEYCR